MSKIMAPKNISVIAVVDDSQREAFIQLAMELDKRSPERIPRFYASEQALLDTTTNFFFRRGYCQCWIAIKASQVVGRIAAMVDQTALSAPAQPQTGFIGLYDAEADSAIADALITTATTFLKNEGCDHVSGPIDFSIYHRYRYQSDSFDSPCFVGEPRNPQYYLDHFLENGFSCSQTWQSHYLTLEAIEQSMQRLTIDYHESLELGYQYVAFDRYQTDVAIKLLWQLVQKTYRGMPGFFELSLDDFRHQYISLWPILDRKISTFLLDNKGETIGFSVIVQDKAAALSAMKGKTHWWAKLQFKRRDHPGGTATAYQTGIVYRAIKQAALRGLTQNQRRLSIAKALYYHCAKQIKDHSHYSSVIIALLRHDTPNIHITKRFATQIRHYQLLSRELSQLTPQPSFQPHSKESVNEHV